MGLYLYRLKTPSQTVKVTLPDGKVIDAVPSCYLSKPYWGMFNDMRGMVNMGDYGINSRRVNMLAGRIYKAWEGKEHPKYAIATYEDNPEGTLEYNPNGFPYIWLEEIRGTETVGEVKRIKRTSWKMEEWGQGYSEPIKPCAIHTTVVDSY